MLTAGIKADTMNYEAQAVHDAEVGVKANAISYNTVTEACAEAHDVAKTDRWLSMMLR